MAAPFDLEGYEVVDLTHTMYHRMPAWVDQSQFLVQDEKILQVHGASIKRISMHTHHGTHVDAPAHFLEGGLTVDRYPVGFFMGEALVLDVSSSKPAQPIPVELVRQVEGEIRVGDILLLHTGWDRYRGYNTRYLYEWPYVDLELAHYLASRKLKMVGTDGLSIGGWGGQTPVHGRVTDTGGEVHRILLGAGTLILEELANLGTLLDGESHARVFLVALPLNIEGADGSPVRAIAFKPRNPK